MEEAYYPGEEPVQEDTWFTADGKLTEKGQEYYAWLSVNHPDWFTSGDENRIKFIKWLREQKGAFDEYSIPDPDPEMVLPSPPKRAKPTSQLEARGGKRQRPDITTGI